MIKLIFLGTSDAIPSIKRNHTSIYLNYDGETLLIDCGEGTQRQIRKAKLNPYKINRILITHLHGDHVFGLPGLISTLSFSGRDKPLYIYGPKGIKKFMKVLSQLFNFKKNFNIKVEEVHRRFFENEKFFLESEKSEHGIPCNLYSFIQKEKLRINKKKLKEYEISSGPILAKLKQKKNIKYEGKKFSYKELTYLEPRKKISFVLDTLYNKKITKFVEDSDLLICESSFGEELKEKAKEHLHLTSEQAAKIAKDSGSKKLILTHLSQRYENDEDKILNQAKKIFKNTIVAHDFDKFEL